jgi:hypothetical protein
MFWKHTQSLPSGSAFATFWHLELIWHKVKISAAPYEEQSQISKAGKNSFWNLAFQRTFHKAVSHKVNNGKGDETLPALPRTSDTITPPGYQSLEWAECLLCMESHFRTCASFKACFLPIPDWSVANPRQHSAALLQAKLKVKAYPYASLIINTVSHWGYYMLRIVECFRSLISSNPKRALSWVCW